MKRTLLLLVFVASIHTVSAQKKGYGFCIILLKGCNSWFVSNIFECDLSSNEWDFNNNFKEYCAKKVGCGGDFEGNYTDVNNCETFAKAEKLREVQVNDLKLHALTRTMTFINDFNPNSKPQNDKKWVYLSGTSGYTDYSGTSDLKIEIYKSSRSLPQGQEFTMTVKNMDIFPRHIIGSLIARTLCNNDVPVNFDIIIQPKETLGGKSYNFDNDGLTGTVLKSDCDKGKIYPNPKDTTYYEYDRIQGVYIKIKTNETLKETKKPSSTFIKLSPKEVENLNKKGEDFYSQKDYAQAFEYFQKSANQGNAKAELHLGEMYINGNGVAQDWNQAAEWVSKSATKGNADAQIMLAIMYGKGAGVTQSDTKAVEWMQKAAVQGNHTAEYGLGMAYEKGAGITKDVQQAKYWYEKVAVTGYGPAKDALKRLSSNNDIVPPAQDASPKNTEQYDIIGSWNYIMTWPSATNLSAVNGKMTFEPDYGFIKGHSISNPNQRFNINDVFTGGRISNNKIFFKIQTSVPEIIQEYELVIINGNYIKGTIKNVRTKPIPNRPESWDVPAIIELRR